MKKRLIIIAIVYLLSATTLWSIRPLELSIDIPCDKLRVRAIDLKPFDILDTQLIENTQNLLVSTAYCKAPRALGTDGPPDNLFMVLELFSDDEEVLEVWLIAHSYGDEYDLYIPKSQLISKDSLAIGKYVQELVDIQRLPKTSFSYS